MLLLVLLPTGPSLQAQTPSPAGSVYEVVTRARWLHGRQQPRFTPFVQHEESIRIVSLRNDPATHARTIHLVLNGTRGDTVRLSYDAGGRIVAARTALARLPGSRVYHRPGAAERFARGRLLLDGADGSHVALPAIRARALVARFPDAGAVRGLRWSDTLDVVAERDGIRQRIEGVRISTIVADTLVDGRTMWIVADSASVRYADASQREERTLDTLATVVRTAEGTIRGRHVYDPASGLIHARHDTTTLAGVAELMYPDGRSFSTPARYERTRSIVRYAPVAYAERREALAEQRRAQSGGMVRLPANELEKRLAAGDAVLRDSLVTAWRNAADADERLRLFLLLYRSHWGAGAVERLRQYALEDGDTTFVLQRLASRLYGFQPFGLDALQMALPLMSDPGLAFAFGVASDPLYEKPRQGLLLKPPALTPDTTDWPCTPEACALLAAQTEAAEARLRGLALVAQVTLDPRRYADDVEAAVTGGQDFAEPAYAMLRGSLIGWPSIDVRTALPTPADDWRAWLRWMNPRPAWLPDTVLGAMRVNVDRHVVTTIRMHELVSGRNVAAEIRQKLDNVESDSAHLVYGAILMSLEDVDPDPAAIAAQLRSASEPRHTLALHQLARLFERAGPWSGDSASVLIDRLLGVLVEGAEPWPALEAAAAGLALGPIVGQDEGLEAAPVFILADGLPPEVAAAWRDRASLISRAEWERRPTRLPAILFRTAPVQRAGPFVRLRASYQSRYARTPDQQPRAYAGGVVVTLMRTADGWVVVAVGGGVT